MLLFSISGSSQKELWFKVIIEIYCVCGYEILWTMVTIISDNYWTHRLVESAWSNDMPLQMNG